MGKITPLVLHFDAVCLWMVPALCVCVCVYQCSLWVLAAFKGTVPCQGSYPSWWFLTFLVHNPVNKWHHTTHQPRCHDKHSVCVLLDPPCFIHIDSVSSQELQVWLLNDHRLLYIAHTRLSLYLHHFAPHPPPPPQVYLLILQQLGTETRARSVMQYMD